MELYCVEYTMLKKAAKEWRVTLFPDWRWWHFEFLFVFLLNSWMTSILNVLVHNTHKSARAGARQCRCVSCSVCVYIKCELTLRRPQCIRTKSWCGYCGGAETSCRPSPPPQTLLSVHLHLQVGLRRCSHGVVSALSPLGSWFLQSSRTGSDVFLGELRRWWWFWSRTGRFEVTWTSSKVPPSFFLFILPAAPPSFQTPAVSVLWVDPTGEPLKTHLVRLVGCWKPAVDCCEALWPPSRCSNRPKLWSIKVLATQLCEGDKCVREYLNVKCCCAVVNLELKHFCCCCFCHIS